MAETSILNSIKTNLDIEPDNDDFDGPLVSAINGVFSVLNQIGIGPAGGFEIEDDTATWDAFYGTNKRYNLIRTYVTMAVRNIFDPPQTAHHARAMQENLKEYENRISMIREETAWVDPTPVPVRSFVLDGGDA